MNPETIRVRTYAHDRVRDQKGKRQEVGQPTSCFLLLAARAGDTSGSSVRGRTGVESNGAIFNSRSRLLFMSRVRNIRDRTVALGFAVAMMLCGSVANALAATPITRLRDMLDLPPATLAAKPEVHIRAVVTCANKRYQMVFVQDASGGAFLFEQPPGLALSPGDEVDIRGVAVPGSFSILLQARQIALIGKTNLPPARPVPLAIIASGALTSERVETEGVVQRVSKIDNHLFLSLGAGEYRCLVSVPDRDGNEPLNALDARVRVRGVATADSKLTGFHIVMNDLSDIQVIARPPMDAFESLLCPMGELSRARGRRAGEHRVHVRGVVTLHWPGRATVVQDSTGGVLIENGVAANVKVGDELDIAGFLAPFGGGNRLRNVEVRAVGSAPEHSPAPTTLADAPVKDNMLVRIMARVVEWQPARDGEVTAILSFSNELFTAVMPATGTQRVQEAFPRGCVISAVGVMKFTIEMLRTPRVALWLRNPSDLRLMQAAPASPWKWVWISAGVAAFLAVGGVAAFAVFTMRHQRVLAQTSVRQREAEQQFTEMERQLIRSHRDRERIAQELHDNIIQSIYSVGLGLDEAQRLTQKNPERVQDRLHVAVQSLNGIIRDVRAFLVGLEPKGLEGYELKAALKSVLLTTGEDQQGRFSIQIDSSAARDLNSLQATEVFNIAKEAMSNSMRHAQAPLTTVSLVPRGRGVRLEVADNGSGFDPARVNGEGRGLRNIQNRARNIGAQLEIISAPGQGTRLVMDIPLSPHDDH